MCAVQAVNSVRFRKVVSEHLLRRVIGSIISHDATLTLTTEPFYFNRKNAPATTSKAVQRDAVCLFRTLLLRRIA